MIGQVWRLISKGLESYINDEVLTRGAAIAFYAVTAIVPILYITLRIAGIAFGEDAARGAIAFQLRRFISRESADFLQIAVRHASESSTGVIVPVPTKEFND